MGNDNFAFVVMTNAPKPDAGGRTLVRKHVMKPHGEARRKTALRNKKKQQLPSPPLSGPSPSERSESSTSSSTSTPPDSQTSFGPPTRAISATYPVSMSPWACEMMDHSQPSQSIRPPHWLIYLSGPSSIPTTSPWHLPESLATDFPRRSCSFPAGLVQLCPASLYPGWRDCGR
jgi:hypothetical protein